MQKLCSPALLPVAIGAGAGLLKGMGQKQEAANQAAELRQNAYYLNRSAEDAVARGNIEADRQRQRVAGAIGTQRTAQAANGGEINTDSNALTQQDTAQFGELDALTISNNAAREAYGYAVQADANLQNAKRVKKAGSNALISSVLGGALSGVGGETFTGLFGAGSAGQGAGTQAALSRSIGGIDYGQALA